MYRTLGRQSSKRRPHASTTIGYISDDEIFGATLDEGTTPTALYEYIDVDAPSWMLPSHAQRNRPPRVFGISDCRDWACRDVEYSTGPMRPMQARKPDANKSHSNSRMPV